MWILKEKTNAVDALMPRRLGQDAWFLMRKVPDHRDAQYRDWEDEVWAGSTAASQGREAAVEVWANTDRPIFESITEERDSFQ
jgi:hypothetical protein